jgi:hypothetical protein
MITIHHLLGLNGALTDRLDWNCRHNRIYLPDLSTIIHSGQTERATFYILLKFSATTFYTGEMKKGHGVGPVPA